VSRALFFICHQAEIEIDIKHIYASYCDFIFCFSASLFFSAISAGLGANFAVNGACPGISVTLFFPLTIFAVVVVLAEDAYVGLTDAVTDGPSFVLLD